jgi:uncharacterized membrane protein
MRCSIQRSLFVYALVVLRAVRGTAELNPFVPQLAITVAFAFVLGSVVVFLVYIHHIAQSIGAATIVATIAQDTRALLERRYPPDARQTAAVCFPQRRRTGCRPDSPAWCNASTTRACCGWPRRVVCSALHGWLTSLV